MRRGALGLLAAGCWLLPVLSCLLPRPTAGSSSHTHPSTAAGLDKCHDLNTLVLSHNAVGPALGAWAATPKLEKLSLSHNRLESLGGALR